MRLSSLLLIFLPFILNANSESARVFPENFKFCVSTAAHQIEGDNIHSDWWAWEKLPGKIKNAEHSGKACDHWNRIDQDIELIQWLGVKQYRFSIEWARIEPRQGEWDRSALDHYREEIRKLNAAGIEPMITLHHFTLPKWFQDRGGWMADDAPALFEAYAGYVFYELGAEVRDWITFNEPMVHLAGGYLVGLTPPERKDLIDLKAKPVVQLLNAHARAYHRLHHIADARHQNIRVGLAHHLRIVEPYRRFNVLDRLSANILEKLTNWNLPDAIETGRLRMKIPFTLHVNEKIDWLKGTQDFIGVNYYTRDLVKFTGKKPIFMEVTVKSDADKNDMGWEIYPHGFEKILTEVSKRYPGKPILITENGIADALDTKRPDYIKSHLEAVLQAISNGAPIEGYCHWSLMDNFEWIEGFTPRFGLFEVNYRTFERKPRESAHLYKRIIEERRIYF